MKYRKDFVTNSSSSSYTCDICHCTESGYDMGLSEAEMYECENGHTICERHTEVDESNNKELLIEAIKSQIKDITNSSYYKANEKSKRIKEEEKTLNDILNDDIDEDEMDDLICNYEVRYKLPSKFCPICNFKDFQNDDLLAYIVKKLNVNLEETKCEIKNTFKEYNDFQEFLK